MNPTARAAGAVLTLAVSLAAQDLAPGVAGDALLQAEELRNFVAFTGILSVMGATASNGELTVCPAGELAEETVFGTARGFESINGFAIANGALEGLDDDGVPTGSPGGCYTIDGIPNLIFPPSCGGSDAELFNATGFPTADTTVYEVELVASQPVDLSLTYNFVTFEDVTHASFADSFGVFLDGVLLAGGVTNVGPVGGTDPWSLTPSAAMPWEFQSIGPSTFACVPAHETGARTLVLALAAGNHTLAFKVADGGPMTGTCPNGAAIGGDRSVQSMLLAGVKVFKSPNAAAVTPGLTIDYIGHPAPSGGAFPDDLQIAVQPVPVGSIVALMFKGQDTAFTFGFLTPLEIYVNPLPNLLLLTVQPALTPTVLYPPVTPPMITPTALGMKFYMQWWGLTPFGFLFNTQGLRVQF